MTVTLTQLLTQPKHCTLYYYFSPPNKITILVVLCLLNTYYPTKHQHPILNGCSLLPCNDQDISVIIFTHEIYITIPVVSIAVINH